MVLRDFISARLRDLRRRHELTQEQVALLLDTDVKWYQRIEWRQKDVRASTIERLAALYGLTAIEFLSRDLPPTRVRSRPPGPPHKAPRRPKKKEHALKTIFFSTAMPNDDNKRRPMLTRREQVILVFLLALLVVGGIVRKLRTEGQTSALVQSQKP